MRLSAILVALGVAGCRIGFDEIGSLEAVDNAGTPTGIKALAPADDHSGFGLAWTEYAPGATIATWRFGVMDVAGTWIAGPHDLFDDRPQRLESVQLRAMGSRWVLARDYDFGPAMAPLDLTVLEGDGVIVDSFEDVREHFAKATTIAHANGFEVIYHHHRDVTGSNYRQVHQRSYDRNGASPQQERTVLVAPETQFLVDARMIGNQIVTAYRVEPDSVRVAFIDIPGNATTGVAVQQVSDQYWDRKVVAAAGLPVFVDDTTSGLRLHRIELSGAPSWAPYEVEVPLGINRFESRTWHVAGDDTESYLAWESDETTEATIIRLARIDASGATPALVVLEDISDGTAIDSSPQVAVNKDHVAVVYLHERGSRRKLLVEVRER